MTRRIRFVPGLTVILTLSLCAGAHAQPTVTSVSPPENDLDAAPAADVTATFSENMNVGGASTFVVRGSMTGDRTGTYGGGGTSTLSFDPAVDFLPGERVVVTLTTGLTGTGGTAVSSPYTWEFVAAAGPAPGSFWSEHTVDGAFDGATSVYAADVDGDGDLDLLGAAYDTDTIAWWENTEGDGSAWTEHTVAVGFDGAKSVHAADVDGDGDLDVLGAAHLGGAIAWWENTAGDGSAWTEHTVHVAFDGATSVYAADVDGDGDLDVLGAARDADDIAWWENTAGDGSTWIKQTINGTFDGASSVYAADVDGDGDLDVLGAAYLADDITWWENTAGDGSAWTEQTINGTFDGALSVYAADVDGDGDVDVLGAAYYADDIAWWENTAGNGSAWSEQPVALDFDGAWSVHAADVDGDGDPDVLGAATLGDAITWWENTAGNGSAWSEQTIDGAFDNAKPVYAADVDGDGDLDVLGAATNADAITWWENMAMEVTATTPLPNEVAAAVNTDVTATFSEDMNVGGASTFVVRGSMTGDRTGTYGGDGTTTLSFDPATDFLPGERVAVTLTAGLTSTGGVPVSSPYAWEFVAAAGTAPGNFPFEHTVDGAFDGATSVYAADVDGDGDLDVLGAAILSGINWAENTVGDGSNWTEHTVETSDEMHSVYAADVDGDGDLDVLGAARDADTIAWWENTDGNGSFGSEHTVDGDFSGAVSVYAADVDGDGDVDVLGAAYYADDITWWENTWGGIEAPTVTATYNEELALPVSVHEARAIRAAEVFIE